MRIVVLIFLLVVLLLYFSPRNSNVVVNTQLPTKINYGEKIKRELERDKFVKPQHNLLFIFNQMSSYDKVVLKGDCQTNIYTRDTIPENKNEYLIELSSLILGHVKNIDNEQDYYLRDIDQVYYQMDRDQNKRYIVVAFIYDIRNYYTLKIVIDFVRKYEEDQLYINSIGSEFSSNYNILNRYDYTIFSKGYLKNYDMFHKDARAILDENYKKYFKLQGVNDTSLEFNTYRIDKANFKTYDLDDYNKYYYPPGLPNVDSGPFCEKHLNDWSKHSVKFENPYIPKDCVANNNAAVRELNLPYDAPGVVTTRTDQNMYSEYFKPERGNIIRAGGGVPF